jgi:hypothetical protein
MMRLDVRSIPYISLDYITISFTFYFSNNYYKSINSFFWIILQLILVNLTIQNQQSLRFDTLTYLTRNCFIASGFYYWYTPHHINFWRCCQGLFMITLLKLLGLILILIHDLGQLYYLIFYFFFTFPF